VSEEAIDLAKLILRRDGDVVDEIEITGERLTIGRDASCDVVLDDRTVSRRHALLLVGPDAVVIEDLGSRNGTFVAGKKIDRHTISPGDTITIGSYRISFAGIPVPAEAPHGTEQADQPGATAIISAIDARTVGSGEDIRKGMVAPEAMAKRLSALAELGQKLCGRLSISEIAEAFLDVVFEVFTRADRAVMLLEDRQSRELVPIAVRERGTSASEVKVSRTVINTVLEDRHAVICGDTGSDARFKNSVSLQDLRIKSIMCVPLIVSDRVLGMLELDSGSGGIAFGEDDLRLLTGLASQVSIVIENGRLYDEIEQSRRLAAIGQTVSGVAHCVKNVLNGIEGGLFIARKGIESSMEEKVTKGWDMLERNSTFLKTLVLDMLDYSKNRPPEYTETDLAGLFGEMMAFVEGRAVEVGIDLSLEVDKAIGPVKLDATRMKRALLNIVGNAIEATPSGGKVSISAVAVPPDRFLITIADTGGGIPPDRLATIFEPFFSTKGSKGTGLGLPVMKKIIEEHGGKVELESEVDKGTTFRITLPIGREDATGPVATGDPGT
jgi:signal transduction histidine kinase